MIPIGLLVLFFLFATFSHSGHQSEYEKILYPIFAFIFVVPLKGIFYSNNTFIIIIVSAGYYFLLGSFMGWIYGNIKDADSIEKI